MPESRKTIELRWRAFVDEYIKHFNAQRAYEDCGCYKGRGKSAQVNAFKLLANDSVQRILQEAIEARNERLQIDQDRVLLELARVGYFDLRSAAWWDDDGLHLVASEELTEHASAAIAEVQVEVTEFVSEAGVTTRTKRRIKSHGKLAALDKLARHVGLYEADNKRTIDLGNGLSRLLDYGNDDDSGNTTED